MSNKDEDFIMDEFEWALKDPTEEKLRDLGEVVSTITRKLVEAITELQQSVYDLQDKLAQVEASLNAKISSLERIGVSAAASPSPAASAGEPIASAPIAQAPPPKAPSGPGGMMGELKALLAARRKKTEGG
ncbi:MAG: hypothetical protein ACFE7R_08755 [Candidatus Hodarchaeota archaeon]